MNIFDRSKALIVATALCALAGCVPAGYYDPCSYGCYRSGVVLQYESYGPRPYYGRPHYYGGHRWDRHRHRH